MLLRYLRKHGCQGVYWKERDGEAPVVCDGHVWERIKNGNFKTYS